jgi:hypothetical protein
VRTFLTLFVSSEGAKASEIVDKLGAVGFKPILGTHDFVYDWSITAVTPQAVIELVDRVQGVLKGDQAILHFVTEQ